MTSMKMEESAGNNNNKIECVGDKNICAQSKLEIINSSEKSTISKEVNVSKEVDGEASGCVEMSEEVPKKNKKKMRFKILVHVIVKLVGFLKLKAFLCVQFHVM